MIRARIFGLGAFLLLMILASGQNVFADSYTYTTAGCFVGGSCTSNGSSVNFTNVFTGSTDATLSFSDISSPTTVGSGTLISLGSFTFSLLNPGLSGYSGQFNLNVDFSNPAGTGGSPLVASVLGGVLINAGGAVITFNQSAQTFSYPGGSFTLDLDTNPVYVTNFTKPAQLDATIVNVTAPEGSGLAMLALSGIVTLGAIKKKAGHLPRIG